MPESPAPASKIASLKPPKVRVYTPLEGTTRTILLAVYIKPFLEILNPKPYTHKMVGEQAGDRGHPRSTGVRGGAGGAALTDHRKGV